MAGVPLIQDSSCLIKYSTANIPKTVTKDQVVFNFFEEETVAANFTKIAIQIYILIQGTFYWMTLTFFNREVESMFILLKYRWTFVTALTNMMEMALGDFVTPRLGQHKQYCSVSHSITMIALGTQPPACEKTAVKWRGHL